MSDAGTNSPHAGTTATNVSGILPAFSGSPASSEYARSLSALPASATTPNLADSPASLPQEQTDRNVLKSLGMTDDEIALKLEHARQKEIHRQLFEQHMAQLERKQQEEEHALRAQSASRASSVRAPESRTVSPQGPGKLPFFADDPEEGLHGSNVPGLRSMPHSRRQSGEEPSRPTVGTNHLNSSAIGAPALKSNRPPRSRPDLVYAFDRLNVSGATSPSHASGTPGTRPLPQHFRVGLDNSDGRSASPGAIGRTSLGSTNGPNALQNVLNNSSRASSPAVGKRDVPVAGGPEVVGGNALPPVFSETFLLDDELDAESAFVKKYHLEDDDKFDPAPERMDSFPDIVAGLSANSAALDLAPLAQTNSTNAVNKNNRGRTSEWPTLPLRDPKEDRLDRLAPPASPRGVVPGSNGPPSGILSAPSSAAIGQSNSTGHLSPVSGRGTPMGEARTSLGSGTLNEGCFDQAGFPGLYGDSKSAGPSAGFGVYPGFDASVGGANSGSGTPGGGKSASGAGRTSEAAGTRPNPSYFDVFTPNATASASSIMSHSGKFSSVLQGQETNKLPPASTAAAAAAAAAAAGLKQSRKGELDANTKLEDLQGEIFGLCKDQHGCRYLQKKLEDGILAHRDMIFAETFPHFAELMTDPFGNYLCQKMLEYCSDEQRNLIVESVAGELVRISLNMHGTRAVQKTIDYLSTPRQIHSIIVALSMNVVTLIKDLNGNHVIQKCLNRLGSEDNQFIYNAVAAHTVEVATHRHGCCVLQRCIDHASDAQRMQLVTEITYDALTLVQDPFGNYVVQYVLDLNDPRCSEAVISQFVGNVCALSIQKFSSNVMEKCIRVSEQETRKQLINELLDRSRLEKLLRDSFANYVVQTALNYADPLQRMQLVECIRPILPMIRNTPYGKRIQSKLQRDSFDLHGTHNRGHPQHHAHGHHGRHGGAGHAHAAPGAAVGRAAHTAGPGLNGGPYAMYPTAPVHPIPLARPEYDQAAYMGSHMGPSMPGMMGMYLPAPSGHGPATAAAVAARGGGGLMSSPAGVPAGVHTGVSTGVTAGVPAGVPTGVHAGIPAGVPTGVHTGLPLGPVAGAPGPGGRGRMDPHHHLFAPPGAAHLPPPGYGFGEMPRYPAVGVQSTGFPPHFGTGEY